MRQNSRRGHMRKEDSAAEKLKAESGSSKEVQDNPSRKEKKK